MASRKRVTKRASYRDGVEWIASNDNNGADRVKDCGTDQAQIQRLIETIAGYVSTLLLADLFGAEAELVARDIFKARARSEGIDPPSDSGPMAKTWEQQAEEAGRRG